MKRVFLLFHQGLGDHLNMNGAVRYFSTIYEEIYYLVTQNYLENVRLFFEDLELQNKIKYVILKTVDYQNFALDYSTREKILKMFPQVPIDIEIKKVGFFLHENDRAGWTVNNNRTKRYLNNLPKNFYDDIGVDFSHFRKSFAIPKINTEKNNLPSDLSSKTIMFVHDTCSDNKMTRFGNILKKFFYQDSNTILINVSENMYQVGHQNYEIAQKYVNLPILSYVPIICRASEIHVSDSSFFCLAIHLVNTALQKCIVYPRTGSSYQSKYHFIDQGWNYVFLKELQEKRKKKFLLWNAGGKLSSPTATATGSLIGLLILYYYFLKLKK